MAYFGKEFKVEKEENYKEILSALVTDQASAKRFAEYKPNIKLEKDGDGYKFSFIGSDGTKAFNFKSGVTFDDATDGFTSKITFTLTGDTLLQVQTYGEDNELTVKREFTDNNVKETTTANKWDGVAYRWYSA